MKSRMCQRGHPTRSGSPIRVDFGGDPWNSPLRVCPGLTDVQPQPDRINRHAAFVGHLGDRKQRGRVCPRNEPTEWRSWPPGAWISAGDCPCGEALRERGRLARRSRTRSEHLLVLGGRALVVRRHRPQLSNIIAPSLAAWVDAHRSTSLDWPTFVAPRWLYS